VRLSDIGNEHPTGQVGLFQERLARVEQPTIAMVYSCFKLDIVLNSSTTIPPPSTVSMVLASKFGVIAS